MVSQARSLLLVEAALKSSLATAILEALAPWRKPQAAHDFGWILLNVALATALGGDCLAGVGLLRADPVVFGPVAADPTISPRLVYAFAASGPKAFAAIRSTRSRARQ